MTLSDLHCCIIIPTYNNERTLALVLDGVLAYSEGNDIIVVNDGSTDSTADILNQYKQRIRLLANEQNTGKGSALKKGFAFARAAGFKNAITIDSDGQHYPTDIPKFLALANEHPGALIMGSRNMEMAGAPGKSSFGNKFSNFWFWVETGLTLPDTQTGFRLYPLEPMSKFNLFTTKFETEIEVIVKLAWRDVPIYSAPINVLYDKATRVSHFRPFRDFTRISILNTYFVTLTLLYYLPKRIIQKIARIGLMNIIKEEALKAEESNVMKAASIGFGVFMGIVPIWGFQLLVGIPLAILFRMNKVLFIAAANISLPPMIPLIIFSSYYAGGFFVQNKVELSSIHEITRDYIHMHMLQYVIGSCVLSVIAGLAFFSVFYVSFLIGRKDVKQLGR